MAADMSLRGHDVTLIKTSNYLHNENFQYLLKNNGKISAEMAKLHAETEFEKYRIIQDKIYISDFDKLLEEAKRLKKDK